MIPILDTDGNVVAFGARSVSASHWPKQAAKYINSAESLIFSKREVLYGMPFAQRQARKQRELVIVEGYMDVIALQSAGILNAVACLGTALSEQQMMQCCQLMQVVYP